MAKMKPIMKRPSLARKKSASAPEDFGKIGAPLNHSHPFYFGFVAAAGAITALTMMRALASASQVFVLIIISLFFAMGLNPAVAAIQSKGLSRKQAVVAIIFGLLLFIAIFIVIVIPPLIKQVNSFISGAPQLVDSLRQNAGIAKFNDQFGLIDTLDNKLQEWIKNGKLATSAFGGVLGVGKTVISGTLSALTIIVLTLYFIASLPSVTEMAYRLVPASRRERVTRLSDAIIKRVGAFVGSQVIVAILAGIFVLVLALILTLPYSAALAMIVLFCGLIPLVGHFLGISIVTIVALSQSPKTAIIAFLGYVIYVQIENYVITPRIMKKSLAIPGLVTIVAALLGTSLLGLVGGILAVPIAAAILLILDEVVYPNAAKS